MSNIQFDQCIQVNRGAFGDVQVDGSVIHGIYGKAIGCYWPDLDLDDFQWERSM